MLPLLAMRVPSPLAQAVPTQPAALAQGCLDKAQPQHLARALDLGKGLCLGVTPPRHHRQDSALDSPQVSVYLRSLWLFCLFPQNSDT